MQHNDLDALIRQISQQCGDPAAAARLKARMQNPEQQRSAPVFVGKHPRANRARRTHSLSGAYDKNSRPAGSSAGRPHKGVVAHV